MSGFAYVIHYFNDQGAKRFPELFVEHRRRAQTYQGFVSLRRLIPDGEPRPSEVTTMLEFSDQELMMKWRASQDHQWVAKQYSQFWIKDPHVVLYTAE
jgi:hypothetical protein